MTTCYCCDETGEEMEKGPPLCKLHRRQCGGSLLSVDEVKELEKRMLSGQRKVYDIKIDDYVPEASPNIGLCADCQKSFVPTNEFQVRCEICMSQSSFDFGDVGPFTEAP